MVDVLTAVVLVCFAWVALFGVAGGSANCLVF